MKISTTSFFATAISAALFAGAVSAASSNIYGAFAEGNPDLYPSDDDRMVAASLPGVGDSYNHFGDWARGNNDLFTEVKGETGNSEFTDIYRGLGDNPDL